jgi:alpha/beta superfamily hydrolase
MANSAERTAFAARGDSVQLEGEIYSGTSPGVVLCHPHPLYGGSMDSVVVQAIFSKLADAGLASLRFNFRGTGNSTGSHGSGDAEVCDVLGAIDHLKTLSGCETICLAGYSFGAAVALKALEESKAARFVAVALPTEKSSEYYGCTPIEVAVPSFIAGGENDQISRFENINRVVKFLHPPEKLLLRNCDHFFSNLESLNVLCDNILRFITGK